MNHFINRLKKKNNPLVSVIVPTYNQGDFISQSIESVLIQTFQDFEVIIINDFSTDATLSILEKYQKRFGKKIRVINHTYNYGISGMQRTYNEAFQASKGRLIAILEGDDYWPKNKLEIQIPVFDNPKVGLSYGDWIMTDTSGKEIELRTYDKFNLKYLDNKPIGSITEKLFATFRFNIASSTVMIRKNTLILVGGFSRNSSYPFVDIPTYLILSLKAEFKYIRAILGYYRRQKSSTWIKFVQKSQTGGKYELFNLLKGFSKKHNLNINLDYEKVKYLIYKYNNKKLSLFLNQSLYNENFLNRIVLSLLRINYLIKNFLYPFRKNEDNNN